MVSAADLGSCGYRVAGIWAKLITLKCPWPPRGDGYLVNAKLIVHLTRDRMINSPQGVRWLHVFVKQHHGGNSEVRRTKTID